VAENAVFLWFLAKSISFSAITNRRGVAG